MDVHSPLFKNIANLLIGVLLLNPVVSLAADLAVDAAAGGNTSLGQAGNGVPVINIATPNSKGLSHNRFSEYNVGQRGLILNNATSATQATQLSGLVHGNPNLDSRAAGLILNEVTGSNPSQLRGYTEVAGQAAGVIVANPHGISCDGCGFINTPRASLSTGQPIIEEGQLQRFDVEQGEIAIEGAGLNASNLDQFDLITRSVRINADLHANQLNVITGRNEVDATTLSATAKADDGSQQPLLAVDSSALGGMYAGSIRLVGTEHGVGVRLAGDVAASAGDIIIDANGQLSVAGVASSGDLNLAAQDINLAQGYADGDVQLEAANVLDVTGSLASGGSQSIQAKELYNHGIVEAGIGLDGSRTPQADIAIMVDHLGNAGLVVASGELDVKTKTLDNSSATLAAKETVQISSKQVINHDGQIIAEGELKLDAVSLNNTEGLLSAGQAMNIGVANNFDNRGGEVLGNTRMSIAADQMDNRGGQVGAVEHLEISASQLDNSDLGTLSSQGTLALQVSGGLNNSDQGALISNEDMLVSVGDLNNSQQGAVVARGDLDLQVDGTIDNRTGTLVANGDLNLRADALDNQQGDLSAGQSLKAQVTGKLDNRAGMLASSNLLDVQAGQLDNRQQGQVVTQGDISLRATELINADGVLYAKGNATLVLAGQLDNSQGGLLLADQGLTLRANSLDNRDGTIQATSGPLSMALAAHLNNTNGLLLAGDGALEIQADEIENQSGVITSLKGLLHGSSRVFNNRAGNVQAQDVNLQVTQNLNNDLGHIAAISGDLTLDAQRVSNMHGALFARQLLSINADQLNNNDSLLALFMGTESDYQLQDWIVFYREMLEHNWEGFVATSIAQGLEPFLGDTSVTRRQELLAVLDAIEQDPQAWEQASLIHAERIELNVNQFSQTVTSKVLAEGQLQGTGQNWTNHGFIASDGALDLTLTGHYDSYGTLASVDQLNLGAASLDLELGDQDIGGILGGSDVVVQVAGALNNNGQLTAMGDLAVQATAIDNLGVLGAADQLQVTSERLYNNLGLLFSGQNMLLQVDQLVNHDADIYSLAGLRLSGRDPSARAQRLDNVSGTIESAGNMLLNVETLNNRKDVFREEQVQLEGEMTIRCLDCGGDKHNVDYVGREVFESRVVENSPAALLHSGGKLSIDAGDVVNQFSTLSASGDLHIQSGTLSNLGAVGGRTERTRTWNTGRITDGTDERFRYSYIYPYARAELPKELPLEALARFNMVSDVSVVTPLDANAPAVIQAGGNLLIEAAQELQNSRTVGNDLPAWHDDPTRNEIAIALEDIIKVQINAQLPPDLQQQQVNPLTLPGFSLPDGQQGLFRLVQTPSGSAPDAVVPSGVNVPSAGNHGYLIETNPALTNLGQFLGSDYLLTQLGLEPEQTLKRLGDGLYEQRMLRDAITARTGARFLAGLTNDEAMYRYLMDNALASQTALNLTLGLALTAEQVAALTHDIVWLEEHEVMGEKVLVPVLYLAQAEGRLAANGALIQGQDVTLISGGDLANQGTLRATENLSIVAPNIDNSGLLQAHERVQLIAQNSILNARGGIITGNNVALSAGDDVLNERTATYYDNESRRAREAGTILDSAARIEAANDLSIQAGGDLINMGSTLQAGGDASLSAGQDLVIGAVEESSASLRKDRRHHWENSQVTQHGSEVDVGGSLQASAGNDLMVIASNVEAGENLTLNAQGDLVVAAAANEEHSEYRYRSSDKKITSERSNVEQQAAELVAGGDISLISGENLAVVASRIEATQKAYLVAGDQLALIAAENLDHSFYEKKTEGSFGRKSSRSDTVTRVTQQGTAITTGGDLALTSGGDQTYQAAELTSGADLALTSGGAIAFEGVMDLHQESHEKSKDSWAWVSSEGNGFTDETLRQTQIVVKGEVAIHAVEGLNIDLREINQATVSETIDAMVEADPGYAWIKAMEERGDVDWRLVQEIHDSFDYSHSGLGVGAQLVIAIVMAAIVGPAMTAWASSAMGAGVATSAAVGAVSVSAATNATVSVINNRGDLGAVFKDVTSSDAVKGYVVAGVTAGLTAGVYDNVLSTKTNPLTQKVVVDLGTASGVARFAANQALQGATSTALYRVLGEDSDFSPVLTTALVNTFAAFGFNLVGDIGDTYNLDSGSAEKVALHALMGGLASEAYGGDFATGALAAGVNELFVADLNAQFASLPDDRRTALLTMSSQLVGVLAAGALDSDGDGTQLETGAWVARNSTQYNFLNHEDVELLAEKAEGCVDRGDCEQVEADFLAVSDTNRARLAACEVNGNCAAILKEISAGQAAMDSLRGEASAIAENTFSSRQIADRIQSQQAVVSEGERELSEYVERTQRDYAEGMLRLSQNPEAIEAWLQAAAMDGYLLELGQQLLDAEADLSAMDGMSDEFLDMHAPGWREYRNQMLVSTGYVKDGAALVGDILEPGLLDAIGPAGKAAHVLGVFAALNKTGRAVPDQLLAMATKLDELVAGKPPTAAELAPFRQSAEGRLREEVRQANLVMSGGGAEGGAATAAAGGAKGVANSGAANRAVHESYKDGLRAAMSKPEVSDPALAKLIDPLYRPNATIGSGSTAAAVRQELATGQPVGGAFHSQKATDSIRSLERWLSINPTAMPGDRAAAENIIRDMRDALGGR